MLRTDRSLALVINLPRRESKTVVTCGTIFQNTSADYTVDVFCCSGQRIKPRNDWQGLMKIKYLNEKNVPNHY